MIATLVAYICLSGSDIQACERVEAWPVQQWVGPKAENDCGAARDASMADLKKNAPGRPVWVECEPSLTTAAE